LWFSFHKLDLEKAEEPESKLPTSIGSSKKQNKENNQQSEKATYGIGESIYKHCVW